jgi:hypothetical protein
VEREKISGGGGEVGDDELEEGVGAIDITDVDQVVHLLRPMGPIHRRGWIEKREHDGGATLLPTRSDAARSAVACIRVDRHRICRTRCRLSGEDLSGEEEGEDEGGALVGEREGRWCRPLDLREEGCSCSTCGGSEEGEAGRGRGSGRAGGGGDGGG